MLDYYFSSMFCAIKKKNKFNISIYILFLFFIIFFTKFSTISVNANTYKIDDLEISKPYDNNFNKEAVIDKAFIKAFEQILLKITSVNEDEIKNFTELKNIYSLVESFSIVDERFIDNKYISKFEVEFNKKELFNFLAKKNIFPSIPKEKDLLLVPVLINSEDNQILLFSENPIYVNWNKSHKKYFLLNYILPNEDIEDINLIKRNVNNIDKYNFNEIVSKYAINDYIILIIFQKGNNYNALIKSNLNNKLIISNKKFLLNENQSIENIIKSNEVTTNFGLDLLQLTNYKLPEVANYVLEITKTDYLMRLDADDWISDDFLSVMLRQLSEHNFDAYVPSYVETDRNGNYLREVSREQLLVSKVKDNPPHGACTVFNSDFLRKVGGYSKNYDRQDGYYMWLKILRNGTYTCIPEAKFYYRQHESNITGNQRELWNVRASMLIDECFSELKNDSGFGF